MKRLLSKDRIVQPGCCDLEQPKAVLKMNFSKLSFEFSIDDKTNKLYIRADLERKDDEKGLRHISFFMYEDELKEFAKNQFDKTLNDIRHRMNICGDTITFYDFEFPSHRSSGTFEVPFLSLEIPRFVRKMILRIGRNIWSNLRKNYSEENRYKTPTEFQFTEKQAEKLLSKYGQAKGSVDLQIQEEIAGRFEEDKKDPQFRNMFERLQCIARNSTDAVHQQSHLQIFRDSDSYYWQALTPKNKRIMNGGLIQHSRDKDKPDWSIHT